jgi:hypothetical protein
MLIIQRPVDRARCLIYRSVTSSVYGIQPTPARVRTQWQEEKKLECTITTTMKWHIYSSREHASLAAPQQQQQRNSPFPLTTIGSWCLQTRLRSQYPSSYTPSSNTTSENKEQFPYLARIGESEATLKDQQLSQHAQPPPTQSNVVQRSSLCRSNLRRPRRQVQCKLECKFCKNNCPTLAIRKRTICGWNYKPTTTTTQQRVCTCIVPFQFQERLRVLVVLLILLY